MHFFYLNIHFPCKSAQHDNPVSSNYTVCHSLLAQFGLSFRLVSLGRIVSYFLGLIGEKQNISKRVPRLGCFPRECCLHWRERLFLYHIRDFPSSPTTILTWEKREILIQIYLLKGFPADDKCLFLNIPNVTILTVICDAFIIRGALKDVCEIQVCN